MRSSSLCFTVISSLAGFLLFSPSVVFTKTTSKIVDCKKDINCFLKAAKKCSFAKVTTDMQLPADLGLSYIFSGISSGMTAKSTTASQIKGLKIGKCQFIKTITNQSVKLDKSIFDKDNATTTVQILKTHIAEMEKQGLISTSSMSDADWQAIQDKISSDEALKEAEQRVAQLNKEYKKFVGAFTTCALPVKELVKRITDEKNGIISVVEPDPYCITTQPGEFSVSKLKAFYFVSQDFSGQSIERGTTKDFASLKIKQKSLTSKTLAVKITLDKKTVNHTFKIGQKEAVILGFKMKLMSIDNQDGVLQATVLVGK